MTSQPGLMLLLGLMSLLFSSCKGQEVARKSVGSTANGTAESLKVAGTSTLSVAADELRDVFQDMGDFQKIYEVQLQLMRDGKVVPDQLLVKLKENKNAKKPLASFLFSKLFSLAESTAQMTGSERAAEHAAKFKKFAEMAAMGPTEMGEMLRKNKLEGLRSLFYGVQSGVNLMAVEKGHDIKDLWKKLLQAKEVEFVEPNLVVELSASDSRCPQSSDWGLFHANANELMDFLGTPPKQGLNMSEVVVAVIDSGVDINHKLLKDRIWVNEAERNGIAGVDDDGNGFIDDEFGWNFADNNPDISDLASHGTHVAGIIAADQSTTPRFQGLAPNAKILPCKFISGPEGGSILKAIQCIEYAWLMGADITSNSWGAKGAYSLSLMSALKRAEESGILAVAAAGNDGADNDPEIKSAIFPASFNLDTILSVAAIDEDGRLADISNFGETTVDIGAPGVEIVSTIPDNKFGAMTGTSMATPFVSGAAALLLGMCRDQGKTCNALDVKNALLSSAGSTGHLSGLVRTDGHLNTFGAAQELGLISDTDKLANTSSLLCANGSPGLTGQIKIGAAVCLIFWHMMLVIY